MSQDEISPHTVEAALTLQRILAISGITMAILEAAGLIVYNFFTRDYVPGIGATIGLPVGIVIGVLSELRTK